LQPYPVKTGALIHCV